MHQIYADSYARLKISHLSRHFYCNFVEPHGYKPEKDAWLTEEQNSTIKWCCCSERLTLDALTELNELLKAAGAKTIYLHPYIWTDSKGVEKETVTNQQLLLIQV